LEKNIAIFSFIFFNAIVVGFGFIGSFSLCIDNK